MRASINGKFNGYSCIILFLTQQVWTYKRFINYRIDVLININAFTTIQDQDNRDS